MGVGRDYLTGKWIAGILALTAGYTLLGKLSMVLAAPPGYASAIFPPAGLALAAVLLYGRSCLAGIWLGSFVLNLWIGVDQGRELALAAAGLPALIATGAALQAWLGYALIRRTVGQPLTLTTIPDISRFLLLGGPVSCLVNSSLSVSALYLGGTVNDQNVVFTWWNWWIGDSIGVLVVAPLMLIVLGRPRSLWRDRARSVGLPLLIATTLIVAIFLQTNKWEMDRIEFTFQERAQRILDAIDTTFQAKIDILNAIERLFTSSREVNRDEFRRFVSRYIAAHEEIQALEWIPRVTDRKAFETRVRARHPDFSITEYRKGELIPAAPRDIHYPVLYVVPLAGNQAAFGYDIASSAQRRESIDHAIRTGEAAITAPLHLVQDIKPAAGLLILNPVMRDGEDIPPFGNREAYNRGFATAVLHVQSLLDKALNDWVIPEIAVSLEDTTAATAPVTLYEANPASGTPALFKRVKVFELGGRQWRVTLKAGSAYINHFHAWHSWMLLAAALIFTGLLSAFLLAITGHTARIKQIVERRTQELAEANVSVQAKNRLLNTITRMQDQYITSSDIDRLFQRLLRDLLSITDSHIGLIGECGEGAGGMAQLCVQAVSPPARAGGFNPAAAAVAHAAPAFGVDALFERLLQKRRPVQLSDTGQPPFLPGAESGCRHQVALPIFKGTRIIGMIALARNTRPYEPDLSSYLTPLLSTCGNLISAIHSEQARLESEETLRNREARLRAILDNAADAIVTVDRKGGIDSINPQGVRLLGYTQAQLRGHPFVSLFDRDEQSGLAAVFAANTAAGETGVHLSRQANIVTRSGQRIPVMLALSSFQATDHFLYTAILHDLTDQQRIDRMKSEFISTISHELRTPLTSIRGSLGLLSSNTIIEIPEQARSLLQIADRNAQRLITLINGILDMEKIESGKMRLQEETVALRPVLEQAIEGAQGYADQYNVGIRLIEYPATEPRVTLDTDRFIEVMYNLLSNAIKYSPGRASVTVGVKLTDSAVRIAVHDDGPGIPPDFQKVIFGKFSQADSSAARPYQGTGLGLSISRSLVELMRGRIDFETSQSSGTTFFLEFPLAGF